MNEYNALFLNEYNAFFMNEYNTIQCILYEWMNEWMNTIQYNA